MARHRRPGRGPGTPGYYLGRYAIPGHIKLRSAVHRAHLRRSRAPVCQLVLYTSPRHSIIANLVHPDIISIVMPYLDFKNYEALHVESVNADLVNQDTPSVIAPHLDTRNR